MRRAATVVLLAVLSGAPAVALVCAELCAEVAASGADTRHASLPCHGASPAAELGVGGRPAPDCVTHGAPTLEALGSPSSRIIAFAPIGTLPWSERSFAAATPAGRLEGTTIHAPALPSRSAPSLRVLRI